MVIILIFSFYLELIGATTKVTPQTQECPLWTIPGNDTCVCADPVHKIVRCDPLTKALSVKAFHCMTADSNLNPLVGACLYLDSIKSFNHHYYKNINANSTAEINEDTCGVYKRKGLMCGQCIKDYGFPVYSYRVDCVKCVDYKYNWLKYIALAYLPLTVFVLVIVIFKISANSGLLVGYVTVSQMMATNSLTQSYMYMIYNIHKHPFWWIDRSVITLYSIWNLDFFRVVEELSFCLHPNMSVLGVLSLDYLVAIYPMVTIILTYIIVQKFSYASCLGKPSKMCLYLLKTDRNIRNSLIEAFATLILLSQVKILNVSFNVLTPIDLYNINGTHGYPHVYNDPHTQYLSKQHLPYFVLAIVMSFIFNFLPFLLICLYPCACFQKCLNWTRLRHPALSIFMDSFQGSYKHEPFYFRSFPAVYMIAQLTNLLLFSTLGFEYYHAAASLMLMVIILLVAIARPYRNNWHNRITLSLFSAVLLSYLTYIYSGGDIFIIKVWIYFMNSLALVGALVPTVYGSILCIRGVLPDKVITKVKRLFEKNTTNNDTLSCRINCDQENTPLINYWKVYIFKMFCIPHTVI